MFIPNKNLYIVVDVETTGRKIPDGRIIEIAMIKISNFDPVDYFHTLVNPEEKLPWFITKLTGIKNSTLKKAPTFCEIAEDIVKFIQNGVIVAHNAPFDYAYIKYELERSLKNYVLQNQKICTVKLARKKFPELGKYNLDYITNFFNIPNPCRHRAFGDAMATAEFFIKYLLK